jgi:hypothetical protein
MHVYALQPRANIIYKEAVFLIELHLTATELSADRIYNLIIDKQL